MTAAVPNGQDEPALMARNIGLSARQWCRLGRTISMNCQRQEKSSRCDARTP